MTLMELYERLLWSLEDTALQEAVPFYIAVDLFNDALYDLADALYIVKCNGSLAPDGGGVVVLPEDFMYMERVRWDGCVDLTPIHDVNDAAIGSGEVKQYMMHGLRAMQLYDTPVEAKKLEVWYKAYPAKLVNESDVPASVPPEYHESIPTLYAKAQVMKRFGDLNAYNALIGAWTALKRDLRSVVRARTSPAVWTGRFEW